MLTNRKFDEILHKIKLYLRREQLDIKKFVRTKKGKYWIAGIGIFLLIGILGEGGDSNTSSDIPLDNKEDVCQAFGEYASIANDMGYNGKSENTITKHIEKHIKLFKNIDEGEVRRTGIGQFNMGVDSVQRGFDPFPEGYTSTGAYSLCIKKNLYGSKSVKK